MIMSGEEVEVGYEEEVEVEAGVMKRIARHVQFFDNIARHRAGAAIPAHNQLFKRPRY